jgi:hypothetical protein
MATAITATPATMRMPMPMTRAFSAFMLGSILQSVFRRLEAPFSREKQQ